MGPPHLGAQVAQLLSVALLLGAQPLCRVSLLLLGSHVRLLQLGLGRQATRAHAMVDCVRKDSASHDSRGGTPCPGHSAERTYIEMQHLLLQQLGVKLGAPLVSQQLGRLTEHRST